VKPRAIARRTKAASANRLDEAGNRVYRPAAAYAMRGPASPHLAAVPKLTTRLPVTEYVASLATVHEISLGPSR
jgi:hypothetical protein